MEKKTVLIPGGSGEINAKKGTSMLHGVCILITIMMFSVGCSPRYSVSSHESYALIGNASIEGKIDDQWVCGNASLYPNTEYGAAVINGDIHYDDTDPRYNALVKKEETPSDGLFLFDNLPVGHYTLKCICHTNGEIWMTARQLVQESSIFSVDALENMASGGKLTVATRFGEFTHDAQGNWSPPGKNISLTDHVKKMITLENGAHLVVSLP